MERFQCEELDGFSHLTYCFSFDDEFKLGIDEMFPILKALIDNADIPFNIVVDCTNLDTSKLMAVFGSLHLDDLASLGQGSLSMFVLATQSSIIKNTANFLITCKGASGYAVICDSMACAYKLLDGVQVHE
jgi:hypothetical protein